MKSLLKLVAALLVADLSRQLVAADGCLAGFHFKGLFCGHAEKNYKILAEHLYNATLSLDLANNTRAAESLLGEHLDAAADDDLVELVDTFKSLRGRESNLEEMCGKVNLANVRSATGAMRAGGNLGAKKNTQPVRRLNVIIIGLVAYARSACPAHLDGKWPKLWNPNFTHDNMRYHLEQLARSVDSLSQKDEASERHEWAIGLSKALQEDVSHALCGGRNIDAECKYPIFTRKKDILADQLREYVYKPCREFVDFQEARDVLEPYGDLLTSWHAIEEYLSADELARNERHYENHNYSRGVRKLAYAYGTCQRILAMPVKDVVSRVRKSRNLT